MIAPALALTALLAATAPAGPAPRGAAPGRDLAAERHAAALAALDRDHGPRAVVALTELRELADQVPDRTPVILALARLVGDPQADPEIRALARLRLAREERARGDLQRAAAQVARLGFVTRWLVVGPFDDEGKTALDRVDPPERELELRTPLPGKGREVSWSPLPAEAVVDGEVALGAVLRPAERVAAYALAVVDSPRDQPARLWLGASGRSKVWVNGALALEDRIDHPARLDQRGALVQLKAGPNRLLVKLAHDTGWMGFALRLADGRGDGLTLTAREPAAVREALPALPAPGPSPRPLPGLVERLERQAAALARGRGAGAGRAHAEALRAQVMALALRRAFEPRSAEPALVARRMVAAAPGWLEARLLAAGQEEDRNRRLAQLRAAEALQPGEPRVQRLLAEELLRLDRPHQAVGVAERAVAAAPGWVEARLTLAEARERAGQSARARLERLELAGLGRPTAPALEAAAAAARDADQPRRAAELLRSAVALAFDLPGPRAQLTSLLLQLGDLAGAVALLEEALRLDPGDGPLRLRLADLLAGNDRPAEAELQFEAALRLCAEDAERWERRGRARLRAGRRAEALVDLRRALELRPQQPALKALVQSLEPAREPFEAPYAVDAAALARQPVTAEPGDDLVVLADVAVTRVQPSGLGSRFQQTVVKVLTGAGVDQARRQSMGYTPGRQELRVERGRIHRPDGTVVEAWEDRETSASEPWYRMYYDTHVRTLTFMALQPGDVLEVAWRLDDVAEAALLADAFNDLTPIDGGPARRRLDYVLLMPATRPLHANQPPGLVHTERPLPGGLTEHRWSAGPSPRFAGEPRMPGWAERLRFLHVSTFSSWDEVNRFYWGLVQEQLRPGPELRVLARRLAEEALRARKLPGALPPGGGEALEPAARRAVVAALHAFVVTQTRYVALEFGIHGYKPYPVDQVLERRFGDCKDKASLTHALLASVGIESRLVLLRMNHLGAIPEAPASLAGFNHAILRVPSLDLWLDGTADHSGTAEVPSEDRGATVLVINPAGPPSFGRLPLAGPTENRSETSMAFRLAADGSATVEATFLQAGARAPALRRAYQSEADRGPALERSLGRLHPGLRVEQVTLSDLTQLEEPVRQRYRAAIPRFARRQDLTLSFSPFGEPPSMSNGWATLSARRHPLQLEDPSSSLASYRVALPAGATVNELPPPAASDGPHLAWALGYRVEDGQVLAEFTMTWKSQSVPPADYPAFRDQLVALDRAVARRAVVRLGPGRRREARREARPPDGAAAPAGRLRRTRRAGRGGSGPSPAARRALDGWLADGDPDGARGQLEPLAVARPGEPWSRLGAALLAERALQPERAVDHLARLVEADPDHPLALVALRELARLVVELPELAPQVEAALAGLAPVAPLRGLAAFRLRVARIAAAEQRGDWARVAALRAENGTVTGWTVAGPFGDFAALDFERPFPPEQGRLPTSEPGPLLAPARPSRAIEVPTGRLALDGEPFDGAFHYLAAEVEVAEGGPHLAVLRAEGSFRAWLDGAPLAERRSWTGAGAGQLLVEVTLRPGTHQLLVKLGREAGSPGWVLGLARSDGRPARLATRPLPPGALLPVRPGPFPPPAWTAEQLARALEEGGRPLALRLAAADAVDDLEAAKALAERGLAEAPGSAPLLALRGRLQAADGSLDEQVRRSRAEEALSRAVAADPGDGPARLELVRLLLAVERPGDAEALLAGLPEPLRERWPALLVRARVAQARDQPELAELLAERALAAGAACGAIAPLLDLASQRDQLARADRLVAAGQACPGGLERLAQHRLRRGDPAGAGALLEPLFRWHPSETRIGWRLAQARRAAGDRPGAMAALRALRQAWPRDAALARGLADQLELDGDRAAARAVREEALRLDGADLSTRRLLALEDGREVLDDLAVDAEAVLRDYRSARPRETGSAVLVVDAAAVAFHPGGASTERVHQLVRLLDQQAVDRYGEVQPPEDAQLLRLRTIKADGRVVEPDPGDAKGSRSLSNLEPGDFFELEYLRANRPPHPALPVSAAPFYLAELGQRVVFSSYQVSAPRGFGLEVDAHRLGVPVVVEVSGERELVRVQRREVARLQPEPHPPPSPELLPFIQVGVGDGTEPAQRRRASAMAGLLRPTLELRALAAQLRARVPAGATPGALARAAWEETRARLTGATDPSLAPASAILSRGRGNRLVLMAALLQALGVEARFALVKPFDADQEPYRFGRDEVWPELLLRVSLPGGPAWLDGAGRQVPFGALQERLRDREALILPRPGEPASRDRTPASVPVREGRESEFVVRLEADGSAELTGTEWFSGVIGAAAKELFLRLDAARQRQSIEMFHSGSLTGLSILEVTLEGLDRPDQPLAIRWRGRAPALARPSGGALLLEWRGPPAQLARKFATLSSRTSTLLLDDLLGQRTRVTVFPPEGFAAVAAPPVRLEAAAGRFERRERSEGGALRWEEQLTVPLARISPAGFPAFAAFAAAVDAAQSRPVAFLPVTGPRP